MAEEWRPVVGFEGLYEVSDLGRVRSLDREITCRNRWGSTLSYVLPGKVLRPGPAGKGYLKVTLHRDGPHYRYVHRLVLEAFVGLCPDGMEGCHNLGDRKDNRLSNLRYDTPTENQRDRTAHGKDQLGERNTQAKLTAAEVRQIRGLATVASCGSLAERFGVRASHIARIVRRERWRHVV